MLERVVSPARRTPLGRGMSACNVQEAAQNEVVGGHRGEGGSTSMTAWKNSRLEWEMIMCTAPP